MKAATATEKALLVAHVLPLAAHCPVEKCRPADCPFALLSQRKPAHRARVLDALSEADLAFLAAHCHVCINTKLTEKAVAPAAKSRSRRKTKVAT